MTAGERGDEPGNVFTSFHCQRDQLQPGDPALGAGIQLRNLLGAQVDAEHLLKEAGGFLRREAQVVRADFDQLVAPAQAREREGRVFAAGDHQPHLRRKMIQ